ncbi:MAG TPA: META domain-containing protein [Anaerolineales bacterium]|nr:META domain-containing protein [Anaerolineales bacterium]HRQ92200.1 META domain-containing protein [Anaerolineales bacterium]
MYKRIAVFALAALIVAGCGAAPDGGYPGQYQANQDAQIFSLSLDGNGNANWSQVAENAQPNGALQGTWIGSDDTLEVKLDNRILNFAREEDDSLVLVDDRGGDSPAGLALQPISQLLGTRWVWLQTVANGQTTQPSTADAFVLTFDRSGNVSVETDCNGGGGGFVVGPQRQLSFPMLITTMMFCEGSSDGDFYAQLGLVESYSLTADGVLELHLGGDGGTMEFSPEA